MHNLTQMPQKGKHFSVCVPQRIQWTRPRRLKSQNIMWNYD